MLRHGKAALILALATGLAASAASAQTPAPPAGGAAPAAKPAHHKPRLPRAAKQSITDACLTDAAIFCGDLERKGARVDACLRQNKSSVSSGCAAAL
jgi:hypothetical protein